MKTLKPIYDHDSYSVEIQEHIQQYLYDLIFKPLLDILEETIDTDVKLNAKARLMDALKSGKIQYHDGFFTGQFNATISKEIRSLGAKWNKLKKAFEIPLNLLPTDVKLSVMASREKQIKMQQQLELQFAAIDKSIADLKFDKPLDHVFKRLESRLATTLKAEDLEVPQKFSPAGRRRIEETYTKNLNLYIQKWSRDATVKLRQQVQKNVDAGFRSDRLAGMLREQYKQTKNKAKFLARQETSLLVSAYRQERYQDAGIEAYRWSTSHDPRVRKDHKALSGKIFTWDNPPITDQATGARNHPGQDFNCRCVAIPVLLGPDAIIRAAKKSYAT